jgi:hypothetical protein
VVETREYTGHRTRVEAQIPLGRIGEPAKSAVPALITALNNDHSGMRRAVVPALRRIMPELADQFRTEAQ